MLVDGTAIELGDHPRDDNPYSFMDWQADERIVEHGGSRLHLDLVDLRRR